MFFYSALHFSANCAFTRRGGGRVVFLAGSKMSHCLVCKQLWFSNIFLGIPLPGGCLLRVAVHTLTVRTRGTGGCRASQARMQLEHIRSQGQAPPASFAFPDPSSFSGELQRSGGRNSGINNGIKDVYTAPRIFSFGTLTLSLGISYESLPICFTS